jgi:hypothetical protein
MANELEDFNTSLGDSSKQLKTFQDVLAKNVNSTTILDGAFKTSEQAARDAKRAQEKMAKSISGTISGLTSFSKSLIDGKGSFAPLQSVISLTTKALGGFLGMFGKVGKALGGLVEGAGEVANFMVEQFDKAYGTFEKLSDSGVVTSFEDMKTSARSIGLTMADQEVLLSKRSKDLALFAGSAVRGREEFQKMAVASGNMREEFQRLGISNQEFSDMQMGYLNREMMAGRGQKATTDQLAKGSADYIKQLDAISKLTGASRKEIQSEREARMNEAQYRAGVATLPGHIRDEVDTVMDMMSKSGAKTLATNFGNLVASNGVASSASQREMMATYGAVGLDLADLAQKVRSGAITGEKATMMVADAAKLVDAKFGEQKSVLGEQFALNKNSVENNNLALRAGKNQQQINKDIADEQARIMADENSEGAKLARTKQALYNSTVNLEQMATEGKLVTGSMKLMATGIEKLTETLYEKIGSELPPYLKAKKDERTAIEKVKKTEEELARLEADVAEAVGEDAVTMAFSGAKLGDATVNNMKKVDAKRKELEDAIREKELAEEKRKEEDKKAGITDTSGPTTLSGGGGGSGGSSGGAPPAGATSRDQGVKPDVLAKKAQIESAIGKKLIVTSGFRQGEANHGSGDAIDIGFGANKLSESERNMIFKTAMDVGFKGLGAEYSAPGGAHIHLDTSQSRRGVMGWGSDYTSKSLQKDSPYLANLIAQRNGASGRQARTGGIFSGPESGYLATLHGDEAVVDVSPESGVSQRSLNSSVLGNASNSNVNFEEIYRDMENKLDKLIDLMDMNVGNQRKQLKEKMG